MTATALQGRTAFITGASRGIGAAVGRRLAEAGAHVALASRSGDDLGLDGALGMECDVRDRAQVERAVAAAVDRFGRLDLVVANAGVGTYGSFLDLDPDALEAMVDINLKGAWIVARRVIPHMIEAERGVIVNNSSIAGLRGMGRLSHYAASKWGLTGLTKSWAIELAPHNIRVVSIHPTGVDTPLNDGLARLEGLTTQEIAERSAGNLQPVPWIEAQDVAEAVVFLVSERARYMTGTELVIDAGLLTK